MEVDVRWSLITVTYNNSKNLRDFWSDVKLPDDIEWLVVDNGSQDGSADVARALGATKVIELSRNKGFSAANNTGFDHASGKFVGFINPDVRINIESLNRLEEVLQERDVLLSPQLANLDESLQPNGRGWPFLSRKIRHRISPSSMDGTYRRFANVGEVVSVPWLTGAVVMGRHATFHALGPWDRRFFLYYEDSDLGLRARKDGISNVVVGDVRWIHGWERATNGFRFGPWKRELSSMAKFYSRYPFLLSPAPKLTERWLDRRWGI